MAPVKYEKRIHRLLTILNRIDSDGTVRVKDLAEDFRVTDRTIQRDIRILEDCGFPLTNGSQKGSYTFVEGFNLGRSVLNKNGW